MTAALVALAPAAAGAKGVGTTGGVGLTLPAGARPTAMGTAFVGLADDVNSLHWNPAGLSEVRLRELSLLHSLYLADTTYSSLAYAHPLPGLGTLAGSVNVLDYGDLPRTLERADGLFEDGDFGSTSPQDVFLSAGWGAGLPALFGIERVRVGATLKASFQQLTGNTLVGLGGSVGGLVETPVPGLRVGALADNLGAVTQGGRLLPLNITAGASYAVPVGSQVTMVYAADTRVAVDTAFAANLGTELSLFRRLKLRGGWRAGGVLGGATYGVGLATPVSWFGSPTTVKLDYAAAASGELGDSQRFQLGVQFGGPGRRVIVGRVEVDAEAELPVLTWKGKGPAYHVLFRRPGDAEFEQLTTRPVEETRYPLSGLPSGRYLFRVIAVDPYQPNWRGPSSPDIEVDLSVPREGPF